MTQTDCHKMMKKDEREKDVHEWKDGCDEDIKNITYV